MNSSTNRSNSPQPNLIVVDQGDSFLVIDDGKPPAMYGRTPFTELKYGRCKGHLRAEAGEFSVEEVEGTIVLSKGGQAVPLRSGRQEMARGFLNRDMEGLAKVWMESYELLNRTFAPDNAE